jgi:hypothetical protein
VKDSNDPSGVRKSARLFMDWCGIKFITRIRIPIPAVETTRKFQMV